MEPLAQRKVGRGIWADGDLRPEHALALLIRETTVDHLVGGLGQTIEFTVDTDRAWQLNAVTSRLSEPPQGICGGESGASGAFTVNGEAVTTQARVTLKPGDRVRLDLPGGGGYGERPAQREAS